ncbi:MAG: acyl-CoA dehydrogenase [Gammaproteobacteria bacterium]
MPNPYDAPLKNIHAAVEIAADVTGLQSIARARESLSADVTDSVLENAARFAREVLSPLNPIGDRSPARCTESGVVTSPGFADAYRRFREDGWSSLNAPAEDGGMGLTTLIAAATGEMWAGANLAFAMCPEVAIGAVEALRHHAPESVRERFLPRVVSGEWTAAMSLTEPQAGSDLSTIRTRAEAETGETSDAPGSAWRLFGRKIYISWGDHDFADNIVHLVLARTPDAPEGLRGISLFVVPKQVTGPDGQLVRNDIRAFSIEHKMGIRASPTCSMVMGERAGALGWLIGKRHEGLACMFTMMNTMRLGVGIHSLGLAERALQLARTHAHERLQGRGPGGAQRPIIEHADVRRMLLQMKALTHAARGLVYVTAATLDVAQLAGDATARTAALNRASLLTPVVKAWVSEVGNEVASLGVQVHGGTGYVDDAEISQVYRDSRIGPIFEGTNYIQAQDLLGRKIVRDRAETLNALLDDIAATAANLPAEIPALAGLRFQLATCGKRLREASQDIIHLAVSDVELIGSIAHHYLQWLGVLVGGWQLALAANRALSGAKDDPDARAVVALAGFYASHVMPRALMHEMIVRQGSLPVTAANIGQI